MPDAANKALPMDKQGSTPTTGEMNTQGLLNHFVSRLTARYGFAPDFEVLSTQYAFISQRIDELLAGHTRKGICAYGAVGSGKSTAMKATMATISQLLKSQPGAAYQAPPAASISATTLNSIFSATASDEDYADWAMQYKHICLDDMGREDPYDKYKGKYHMTRLIQVVDEFGDRGPIIHATTNMNRAQTISIYGEHIVDRFSRMMTPIEFKTAKSLRLQ